MIVSNIYYESEYQNWKLRTALREIKLLNYQNKTKTNKQTNKQDKTKKSIKKTKLTMLHENDNMLFN